MSISSKKIISFNNNHNYQIVYLENQKQKQREYQILL